MTSIELIIDRQIRRWELQKSLEDNHSHVGRTRFIPKPLITVSRHRGAGGTIIAERLAQRFNYTLLDRDIIDRICATTGYKRRIVETLDEHSRSQMELWFESIVTGQSIDQSDYARALLEIIFSISRLGGVVVVGRGANFIIGGGRGFHCRIIAAPETRISNLVERERLTADAARRDIESSDHERSVFVRKLVGKSIDDASQYDLVINTDWVSIDGAVNLIANAAMDKFERLARESA